MGMGKGFFNNRNRAKPPKLEYYQGREVMLNPKVFGEGFKSKTLPVSFIFGSGGVGDYISWSAAIKFIQETQPHVDGRLFVSELFIDVARYLFQAKEGWKVELKDNFWEHYEEGSQVNFPKQGTQLINACGAHLIDLGAMYYACEQNLPPEYDFLPEINYEGPWKWPELDPTKPYALFTPGATTAVRELPHDIFTECVNYTLSKGITPVFLGKRDLSIRYMANFQGDLSKGIDLRERTTLLEATQLMRGAKFIIGLDNGLLHMAGTTKCPIIFGHNIALAERRAIRRREGLTVDVTVSEDELACIGCQDKIRFARNHSFKECFFKGKANELACHVYLGKDKAKRWKDAIDKVLEHGK